MFDIGFTELMVIALVALIVIGPERLPRVARTLERHGVNITDLKTQARRGAESGTPIFTMQIAMDVPRAVDRRTLVRELERVAGELTVEIALTERVDDA